MSELDDELLLLEEVVPARADKYEFDSTLYLTWDPFGDRVKVFTKD